MTFHSIYKTPWQIKRVCRREKLYVLVPFTTHFPLLFEQGTLICILHWALPGWAVSAACWQWPVSRPFPSGPAGHSYLPPPARPWLSKGGDLHCGGGHLPCGAGSTWKCNQEEQIWLHVRCVFFYFNLCILLLLLQVKNVAYSLKYTGEPILEALTFKGITHLHS